MSCTVCKNSASKLVTRSLCECCLVHLGCCDVKAHVITEKSIPVVWEVDAVRKVECDICLGEYLENEELQHRESCIPRMVFRCALCDEDYLSEESLWNHLTVHQIAYEKRDLYYQEKRVTYKQYECILCNDQRSYQENSYWQHIHEDHDGYYLQCSECGESFRSKKSKADHGLNQCKSREKASFESGALIMDTNINEHLSQEKLHNVSDKDFEVTQSDQQSSLESEIVESYGQDSTLGRDCDDDAGHVGDRSSDPSDLQCPQCNKECSSAKALSRHIECCHQPSTCDICGLSFSSGNQATYHKLRSHSKGNYQCPTCLKVFRSKDSLARHIKGFHHRVVFQTSSFDSVKKQEPYKAKVFWSAKTDCPICLENFSDQNQVSQHVEEMHKVTICTICRVIFANADELNNHKCSICPHCGKGCYNRTRLVTHIEERHEKATCDVCEVSFYGKSQLWYHKLRAHSEPKLKCSQCSEKFHNKCEYNRHLPFCVKNECKCKLCGRKFACFAFIATHMRKAHGITRPQKVLADRTDKKSDDHFDVEESPLSKSENRMSHDQSDSNFTIEGDDDDTHEDVSKPNTSKSSLVPKFKGKNRRVKAKVSQILGRNKLNIKHSNHHHLSIGNVFPCKLCDRKFKSLAYVSKHIKQVHSVRKAQTNIATSKELKQEPEFKTEISAEETQLQQSESPVLNDDVANFPSLENHSRTNNAISNELHQELELKMEITVEETQLQQHAIQVPNDGCEKSISQHTVGNSSSLGKCPHCGKNFKQTSLIRHINDIHKTRHCKVCGVSFESKRQLSYHVLICHTDPKYKCPHCPEIFHVKYTYVRHLTRHSK